MRPFAAVLAAVAAVVHVARTTLDAGRQPEARPLDALAYALLLAGPAALLLVLRRPNEVLLSAFAAAVVYQILGYPSGPAWVALIVSFVVAASQRRWPAYGVLVAGYVAFVVVVPLVTDHGSMPVVAASAIGAWLLTLAGVAEWVRHRRADLAAARQRAAEADTLRHNEVRRRPARSDWRSPASCTTCSATASR